MKSISLTILLLHFFVFVSAQSIIVNPSSAPESAMNAEDLTREVLISGGACSDISNFQLKENPSAPFPNQNRSWGYFEKGTSDFPFEEGIVLTSGYAHKAQGPNTGNVSDGGYEWTGDPAASYLGNGTANNTTVFEFDFVPFGNMISFNYIFASEEYPTFACSSFNDVFAFIISGPGIVNQPGLNGKNIALLPNGLPVTINNVNNQSCGDDTYYVHGPFPYIEHGGRTTVLTAESEVIPGETYHIRLLVSDISDTSYDSAVFLEAGSFNLGSTITDIDGVELGENKTLCDIESYTIIANVEAPDATYQWYFNGEIIPDATNQEYTATESGLYTVYVYAQTCSTDADIQLTFSESPEAVPYNEFKCSPEGTLIFNLTDYNQYISDVSGNVFTYFHSENGANMNNPFDEIQNFLNYPVSGTEIIYVRIKNEVGCFTVVPLTIEVGVGPQTIPQNYSNCDDNGDGVAQFDLTTQTVNLVTSDPTGLTYEYYLDADTTQLIPNPQNFSNTSNPQTVFVKIYNPDIGDDACISVEALTLIVNEFPELQPYEITICDDLNDQMETIDLTPFAGNIIVTQGINIDWEFYDENGNLINNPTNYQINHSPTIITLKVNNPDNNCDGEETLTINLTPAPIVTDEVVPLLECSIEDFAVFYLPDAKGGLVTNPAGLNFTYHLTYNDALNAANSLPVNYQNTSQNQIIFARVVNTNGCFNIGEVRLTTEMKHEQIDDQLSICDDPYFASDGISVFDLTLMHNDIENIMGGGEVYTIQYYTTLQNAMNETNPIADPTQFENTTSPQKIYSRAISDTGSCGGIVEFWVNTVPVPEFELPYSVTFCSEEENKTYTFDENFQAYAWYDPNGQLVSNQATVEFEQEGIYSLEILASGMDCPARRDIHVIFEESPVILGIEINGSSVSAIVSGGNGPYQFSINNGLTWSDQGQFDNLVPGDYEMIVKSMNGCFSTAKLFTVFIIPNFISPNGDGINDYWEIRGMEQYADARIKIFDRYGKLFVDQPMSSNYKWDGKYRGNPVPSGDYWFILTFDEENKITGHISVRNQ
ncbi:MAG: choice-of-anchor L domain-containing protein [Weeksellaceae bacterium]